MDPNSLEWRNDEKRINKRANKLVVKSSRVDVAFLIDATSSMKELIDSIKKIIRDAVKEIKKLLLR